MIRSMTAIMATAAAVGLATLTAPAASAAAGNLLRNPGFEQGATRAWKGEECCVTTSDPHSGAWIAYMGAGTAHTDKITQQVAIPVADGARLTFW